VNLSFQINIKTPVEKVFDLVSDIDNMKQWMDSLIESEYTSGFDPENAIGVKFRQRASEMGQEVEYEGEIIAYEKPTLFAVRVGNKKFAAEIKYRLSTSDDGSLLKYSAELVKASLAFRLLASAFSATAEKTLARQMQNLKKLAETKA
jgi:uncharacterized protein YndB with AHSA1/START domain